MEGEGGVTRMERSAVAVPGVGEVPVPTVVAASGPELASRFLEFFLVAIRNPNTRRAYAAAVRAFCAWLERHGARDLTAVEPVHVAAYVEQLGRSHAKPSVALHLAAIKRLFAFLVTGGVLRRSPAVEVKGPTFSRRIGATPVTSTEEVRRLLGSLPTGSPVGLRHRALIGGGGGGQTSSIQATRPIARRVASASARHRQLLVCTLGHKFHPYRIGLASTCRSTYSASSSFVRVVMCSPAANTKVRSASPPFRLFG